MPNPHYTRGTADEGASHYIDEAPSYRLPGLTTRPIVIPWPCRDCYSGSLYALPPELCRREVFCHRCTAATCLFGGTPAERRTRQSLRHWAMPDEASFGLYVEALRLYTSLLGRHRTCWHCAGLRMLRGSDPRYVCPHNLALVAQQPDTHSLPSISGRQARLLTALEACGGEHFAPRSASIPLLLTTRWRDMVSGVGLSGRCDHCLHLRSLSVAGRQRYVCAFQANGQPWTLAWRLARSLRVVQSRGSGGVWCRGQEWRLRVGAVVPLAPAAATA